MRLDRKLVDKSQQNHTIHCYLIFPDRLTGERKHKTKLKVNIQLYMVLDLIYNKY